MTPKEFKDKIQQLDDETDVKDFHIEADKLMCEALEELGFSEGIEIFKRHERWYA